jgi:hypothetical protein
MRSAIMTQVRWEFARATPGMIAASPRQGCASSASLRLREPTGQPQVMA